jgi:hypothetical protein
LWDCKNSDKSNCPTGATVMFIMHWQCTWFLFSTLIAWFY